jgi:hypothetical protein
MHRITFKSLFFYKGYSYISMYTHKPHEINETKNKINKVINKHQMYVS